MVGNPKLSCDEISVGDEREQQVVENLTRTQIVQYAGASGDFNPIHHDETFATKAAGYPSVFAPGMLTLAMTARVLTERYAVERIRELGARFHAQVWPGDDLDVWWLGGGPTDQATRTRRLELSTRNGSGAEVLRTFAVLSVPG